MNCILRAVRVYAPLTSDYGTYLEPFGVYLQDGLTLTSYQGTMADVNFNSGSSWLKASPTS